MDALVATSLILQGAQQLQQLAMIINASRAAGRDLTDAEVDDLVGKDNASRLRLQAAIAAAQKTN